MADVPATRVSLLVRLRDAEDHEAWREFVRLYAPLIYRYARRKGLQDADAADLTQEVLRGVSSSLPAFNPERGLFRSWLFTLAHHRLCDFFQRSLRQTPGSGDLATVQLLDAVPARAEEDVWNQDYERQLYHVAAEQVRSAVSDATWQAFERTAVDGKDGREVAQALGISVAAVYLAKSRVMLKLKSEVGRLREE